MNMLCDDEEMPGHSQLVRRIFKNFHAAPFSAITRNFVYLIHI